MNMYYAQFKQYIGLVSNHYATVFQKHDAWKVVFDGLSYQYDVHYVSSGVVTQNTLLNSL
jgi:hypothetical protein